MRSSALFWLVALVAAALAPGRVVGADIDVAPQALQHYSYCVGEARDHLSVIQMDRQVVYRCHGDIAISYFNFLGRRGALDQRVEEFNGVFLYRAIAGGIGRCWNKIADEAARPVSEYGCDIREDL
jgi:hypothetical protein